MAFTFNPAASSTSRSSSGSVWDAFSSLSLDTPAAQRGISTASSISSAAAPTQQPSNAPDLLNFLSKWVGKAQESGKSASLAQPQVRQELSSHVVHRFLRDPEIVLVEFISEPEVFGAAVIDEVLIDLEKSVDPLLTLLRDIIADRKKYETFSAQPGLKEQALPALRRLNPLLVQENVSEQALVKSVLAPSMGILVALIGGDLAHVQSQVDLFLPKAHLSSTSPLVSAIDRFHAVLQHKEKGPLLIMSAQRIVSQLTLAEMAALALKS